MIYSVDGEEFRFSHVEKSESLVIAQEAAEDYDSMREISWPIQLTLPSLGVTFTVDKQCKPSFHAVQE